jgi:hypothetical protein
LAYHPAGLHIFWHFLSISISGSSPIFAVSNYTTFGQTQTGATVPLKQGQIEFASCHFVSLCFALLPFFLHLKSAVCSKRNQAKKTPLFASKWKEFCFRFA